MPSSNVSTSRVAAADGVLDVAAIFMAPDDAEWMDQALCAQTDPESFYPEKGGSTREAKKTCEQCLVRAECLDWALANDERFGIWGGLSERERRAISKTLQQGPTDEPAIPAAADDTTITPPPTDSEGAAA
jgi:WhiB family redox-sensing transcriptional regulator